MIYRNQILGCLFYLHNVAYLFFSSFLLFTENTVPGVACPEFNSVPDR